MTSEVTEEELNTDLPSEPSPRKYEIVYLSVVGYIYIFLTSFYAIYLCVYSAKWKSLLFTFIVLFMSNLGITAGAHRLWAHKTYKAKLPLEILLMIFNSIASQYSAMNWVRDHRLHHKYSDTDADPHNSRRGLFYSHMGWLMVKKHPLVKEKGKTVEMSDIYNNPVLKFQKKYAFPLLFLCGFGIPTAIPVYFWGESLHTAWCLNILRFTLTLNFSSLVNSVTHAWGYKPYDKNIVATENLFVSLVAIGEGFHNYHHVFPWDYRTAELGNNKFNVTTQFIDLFAKIGWAYDLKTVPKDVVLKRAQRTGDSNCWGSEKNSAFTRK